MNTGKIVLITAALLFVTEFAGAQTKETLRFYKNGELADTMYVDSKEGLRVRDESGLSANRLVGIPHRLPVKIIKLGNTATIDGITAPWVKILIPRYLWKTAGKKYGWVFGGYLVKDPPPFSTKNWTPKDLQDYLCLNYWVDIWEWKAASHWQFSVDGYFYIYDGQWKQNSTEKYCAFIWPELLQNIFHKRYKITAKDEFESISSTDGRITVHRWKLVNIEETSFEIYPLNFNVPESGWEENPIFKKMFPLEQIDFDMAYIYSTTADGLSLMQFLEIFNNDITLIKQAIEAGVSPAGTQYENMYHSYWRDRENPSWTEWEKKRI